MIVSKSGRKSEASGRVISFCVYWIFGTTSDSFIQMVADFGKWAPYEFFDKTLGSVAYQIKALELADWFSDSPMISTQAHC